MPRLDYIVDHYLAIGLNRFKNFIKMAKLQQQQQQQNEQQFSECDLQQMKKDRTMELVSLSYIMETFLHPLYRKSNNSATNKASHHLSLQRQLELFNVIARTSSTVSEKKRCAEKCCVTLCCRKIRLKRKSDAVRTLEEDLRFHLRVDPVNRIKWMCDFAKSWLYIRVAMPLAVITILATMLFSNSLRSNVILGIVILTTFFIFFELTRYDRHLLRIAFGTTYT